MVTICSGEDAATARTLAASLWPNEALEGQLAQELPLLRKVPPHFVTWGDGSSDEMCLGIMLTSKTLPDATAPL